ncbi:putative protein kinase RLK-Pelle-LRR-III family [Helianthus debilis subsp. tardiflorus]
MSFFYFLFFLFSNPNPALCKQVELTISTFDKCCLFIHSFMEHSLLIKTLLHSSLPLTHTPPPPPPPPKYPMSPIFIFVFSVLIFHTGATTLSGAYVPVSRSNPMPTSGNNVPGYDPLNHQAKRTLLGFIIKAIQPSSSALNPYSPTCSGNCNGNVYNANSRSCDGGNCNGNVYNANSRECAGKYCGAGAYEKPDLNLQEKQALLSFIKKVPHSGSLNWNESESACSWEGVTCTTSGTTVLYLRLPLKNLTGEIPSNTIGKLTSLRVLSLGHNTLSGEIPSDFSNLNFLTTLYLDHNNFSGNIPSSFSTLSYLTTFDVSYNKLVGPIPPSLSKFPEDAFSNNSNLCGPPLFPWKNMYQYIRPTSENKKLVKFGDDAFDLEDLLKTTVEVLGEGSVGTSYKQVLVGKNKTVVLKILKDVVVTEEEFKAKMDVLGKIKNKYVVPLRAYYNYSSDEKWLVYDYMPAGSLYARLHGSIASRQTQLDWDHRMRIAMSTAKGLAYLHEDKKGEEGEKSVVHGNINSSNVLIRQETNIEVSVSDYGLNTLFDSSSSQDHHVTGYWAPEINDTQEFTLKSDVYSFGVLLLELLTGKTPKQASLGSEGVHFSKLLESVALKELKDEIFDVELRMVPNNVKETMKEFLEIAKDCVSKVPEKRPIMQEVVSKMEKFVVETVV